MMKFLTFSIGMIAMTALLVSDVNASKKFVARIPNGGNVPDTPAIGHPDGTGDDESTNAFGDAFADAGDKWTKELCEADSDGDGQTNGQELGDPCCEWDQTANPVVLWTTGVSHPSDASKTSDPSLWASVNCGGSSASTVDAATSTATSEMTTESSTSDQTNAIDSADSSSSAATETSAFRASSTAGSDTANGSGLGLLTNSSTQSSVSDASERSGESSSSSSSISFDIEPEASQSNSTQSASSDSSATSSADTPSTSSSKTDAPASSTSGTSALTPAFLPAASLLAVAAAFLA